MGTSFQTTKATRISITIPNSLLNQLKQITLKGTMSNYFAAAVEEKLRREQSAQAWEQFMALPPTLTDITDPLQWVNDLRAADEERLRQLGR